MTDRCEGDGKVVLVVANLRIQPGMALRIDSGWTFRMSNARNGRG